MGSVEILRKGRFAAMFLLILSSLRAGFELHNVIPGPLVGYKIVESRKTQKQIDSVMSRSKKGFSTESTYWKFCFT